MNPPGAIALIFALLAGLGLLIVLIVFLVRAFRGKGAAGTILAVVLFIALVGGLGLFLTAGQATVARRTALHHVEQALGRYSSASASGGTSRLSRLPIPGSPEISMDERSLSVEVPDGTGRGVSVQLQAPRGAEGDSHDDATSQSSDGAAPALSVTLSSETERKTITLTPPPRRPRRPAIISQIAGAGVLAVMVLLAYLIVDARAHGRYTWPLRIGAAAAFAAVCLLLWRSGIAVR